MAWQDWRDSIGFRPIHAEVALASESLGVGGTNDAAGEGATRTLVCDWKSSKRSKSSPNGIYYEAKVQVCVYRQMAIEMALVPEDSVACVVRLPKDLEDPVIKGKEPVDVVYIEPEEADSFVEDFRMFRAAWERLALRGQA